MTGSQLAILGLDTGSICPFLGIPPQGGGTLHESIAWMDNYLYFCGGGYNKLIRVDITTGTTEEAFVYCQAVSNYGNKILVEPDWSEGQYFGEMWLYDTFRRAECRDPTVLSVALNNTRNTVYGDTLYTAWHSTDTIEKVALPGGAWDGDIYLENYDTWVNGMSVIDDDLLVVSASWPEGRVAVFDVATGLSLWDVPVNQMIYGLYCMSNN